MDQHPTHRFIQEIPFSHCDYRCLLCPYRKTCGLFDEIESNMREITFTPHLEQWNTRSVISRLLKIYEIGALRLNQKIRERLLGFKKSNLSEHEDFKEKFRKLEKMPLVSLSETFVTGILTFLKKFDGSRPEISLKNDFFNLAYYAPFMDVKIAYSLKNLVESEAFRETRFLLPGYLSARIAHKSSEHCTLALKNILGKEILFSRETPEKLLNLSIKLNDKLAHYIEKSFPSEMRLEQDLTG